MISKEARGTYCPQGYSMQQKVEKKRGLEYCRERCGKEYNKYIATVNATECYWIASGKGD